MNKWILTGLMALPLVAQAELITEREFNRTFDQAALDGVVEIENVAGSIEVHGHDQASIRVEAELGKDIEGVEVDSSGSVTRIKVVYPDKRSYKSGDAELQIWVPSASAIEVTGVSAEIEVDGVKGEQRLKSVSGSIESEAFDADIRAGSVSGDVTVVGSGGGMERVSLESVSGDIVGRGLNGELKGSSVSGDVEIVARTVSRGDFSTTSGDVSVRSAIAGDARIDMESVSGDIEFVIIGSTNGRYDLTTYSGDIETCFGPDVDENDGRSKRHRFWLGEGKQANISASAMSGDIELCKQ